MFLLLIAIATVTAIYQDDIKKAEKDIQSVSFLMGSPSLNYEFTETRDSGAIDDTINYSSDTGSVYGLALETKKFSFSVSTKENEEKKDGDKRINSKYFDFYLDGFYKRYVWELYYYNYQGFNVVDGSDYTNAQSYPDLSSFGYGGQANYYLSENFIARECHSSCGLEKRTNWSWLHSTFIDRYNLSSSNGLIDYSAQTGFQQIKGMTSLQVDSIGYAFGIAGMYRANYFFAFGQILMGIQGQHQEVGGFEISDEYMFAGNTSIDYALGFLTKKSEYGLKGIYRSVNTDVENVNISRQRLQTYLYYKLYF